MPRIAVVIGVAVITAFAGCGDEPKRATESRPTQAKPDQEANDKPSGVDVVATCADATGQDLTASGEPVPGFVACLERLDAPQSVINAWH